MRGRQAADVVGGCLLQADEGTDGHRLVQIAGRLAAPRCTIDGDFARLGVESHHRVVVVQQAAPFDVLQPEAGVRALARAALAQEKIATPFVADDRGVHHQRPSLGGGESVNHHQEVDELNVFPIPDGDTGTNMQMTVMSGVREMNNCQSTSIVEVAKILSRGCLMGARGNSGVILSQFFRGLYVAIKEINNFIGRVLGTQKDFIVYFGKGIYGLDPTLIRQQNKK